MDVMIYYVLNVVEVPGSFWYYFIPWADFVPILTALSFMTVRWESRWEIVVLAGFEVRSKQKILYSVCLCFCGSILFICKDMKVLKERSCFISVSLRLLVNFQRKKYFFWIQDMHYSTERQFFLSSLCSEPVCLDILPVIW